MIFPFTLLPCTAGGRVGTYGANHKIFSLRCSCLFFTHSCWFHVTYLRNILYASEVTCVPLFAYAHICNTCIVLRIRHCSCVRRLLRLQLSPVRKLMAEGRYLQNGVIPCAVLQVCTLQCTSQQHLISSALLRGSKEREGTESEERPLLFHMPEAAWSSAPREHRPRLGCGVCLCLRSWEGKAQMHCRIWLFTRWGR